MTDHRQAELILDRLSEFRKTGTEPEPVTELDRALEGLGEAHAELKRARERVRILMQDGAK